MRSALCLLAIVAISFAAQATQGADVYNLFYGNAECTGTPISNTTAGRTGVCNGAAGSYSAMYCSADGSKIYTYTFADKNCTVANALSVSETPTTCGWSFGKLQQQCVNAGPDSTPPAALAFPPAGWATSSSCMNSTNTNALGQYQPASTCSASGNAAIHCTNSASNAGFCFKSDAIPSVKSMYYGCSPDGANSGAAYFSDDACSTFVQATITPARGCRNGVSATCGSKTLPTLPTKGYTQYDNNNCVAGSTPAATVLFVDGACVNSQTFSCSTINGTQYGTLSTFTDSTLKGTCPAGKNTDASYLPNVCNGKGMVFLCDVVPAGGAASTVAVSMIAMIVASMLAMVAARSL